MVQSQKYQDSPLRRKDKNKTKMLGTNRLKCKGEGGEKVKSAATSYDLTKKRKKLTKRKDSIN